MVELASQGEREALVDTTLAAMYAPSSRLCLSRKETREAAATGSHVLPVQRCLACRKAPPVEDPREGRCEGTDPTVSESEIFITSNTAAIYVPQGERDACRLY